MRFTQGQTAEQIRHLERREAATSANLFRIASVTKPITSVAIFSLASDLDRLV